MKRFSIALLMAVVFLVAADFAIVKSLWRFPYHGLVIAILTLPMINILLLAVGRVKEEVRDGRLYWLGFEAVGWGMVLLVACCTWVNEHLVMSPVAWLRNIDGIAPGTAETAFLISFSVVFYTMPQLLVAMAAGRFFSRDRIIIERRQPSSVEPDEIHAQLGDGR